MPHVFLKIDYISYYRLRMINHAAAALPLIWEYLQSIDCPLSDKVEAIRYHYRFTPKQGSVEWLRRRTYDDTGSRPIPKIGGSELAQVLGKNKYSDKYDLMISKLGINTYAGDISTNWGNTFEDVLFSIIRAELGTDIIFETGSIPGIIAKGRVIQDYSPDGIGLCTRKALADTLRRLYGMPTWFALDIPPEKKEVCVLFEGKSPLRREPTGSIPEHYEPQPKIGLTTIRLADIGIFTEGVFRLCSGKQFDFSPDYNTDFHGKPKGSVLCAPKRIGIIGVFCRRPNPGGITLGKLTNYGTLPQTDIAAVFARINAERFTYNEPDSIYVDYISHTADYSGLSMWLAVQRDAIKNHPMQPVGYIMFKMFKLTFIPVRKDLQYRDECLPKLLEFTDKLGEIIKTKPRSMWLDTICAIREAEDERIIDEGPTNWNFSDIMKKFKYRGVPQFRRVETNTSI